MSFDMDEPTGPDVWGVVKNRELGRSPLALRVLLGNEHLRTVRLEPEITYIGRMPENHVVLDDPKVSRSHARVVRKGDQFVLEDQESENGTFVNGKAVKQFTLVPGAVVLIGGHKLEVVRAQTDDRTVVRENQLDRAEEEEWRMDQTVSGSPEQIAKIVAARKAKKDAKAVSNPKMAVHLTIGKKTIQKEFEFSQARPRRPEDAQADQVEIRICVGKWVLYKKLPL